MLPVAPPASQDPLVREDIAGVVLFVTLKLPEKSRLAEENAVPLSWPEITS